MRRVKIESIVNHCSHDFTRALRDALYLCGGGDQIDKGELFRAFKRECGLKFPTWQRVPDGCVET